MEGAGWEAGPGGGGAKWGGQGRVGGGAGEHWPRGLSIQTQRGYRSKRLAPLRVPSSGHGVVAAGCLAQRSRPSFIVSYFQAHSTKKQWNGNQMVLKSRTTRPETALPRTRAVTTPQPHSPGARKHTR